MRIPSPKSALAFVAASAGVVFSVATSEMPPTLGGNSAVLPDEHEELLAAGESVTFPLHIAVHTTEALSFSGLEVVAALEPGPLRDAFSAPADDEADAGTAGDGGVAEDAGAADDDGAADEAAMPENGVAFRMTIALAGDEGPIADEIINAVTFRDLTTEVLAVCFESATCDATEDVVLTFARVDQGAGVASLFWRAGVQSTYASAPAAPEGDTLTIAIAGPDEELPAGDDDAGTPVGDEDAGAPAGGDDAGAPAGDDAGV